jgi:hypothetical protein
MTCLTILYAYIFQLPMFFWPCMVLRCLFFKRICISNAQHVYKYKDAREVKVHPDWFEERWYVRM